MSTTRVTATIRCMTLWRPWPVLIARPDVTGPAERQRLYATGKPRPSTT
jgi:hypothetical protein